MAPDTGKTPHQECALRTRDVLWASLLAAGGGRPFVFVTPCECKHAAGLQTPPVKGPYRLLADQFVFLSEATDVMEIADADAFAVFLDTTASAAEFGHCDKDGHCFCLLR